MSNPYAPPPAGAPMRPARPADPASADGDSGGQPAGGPAGGPQAPIEPERPPRPPVDPEAARAASRRMMHFGLLVLAAIVTSGLPLPWQVTSLLFAVAAVVVGVVALRAVWKSGLRGATVVVLAAGLGLASTMALSLATMLALWPVQVEHQECLRDALTISAREQCDVDYRDRVTERLDELSGTGSG